MGKKGREIVEINIGEIINDLNKAYADQWLGVYMFWYASKNIKSQSQAKEILERISLKGMEHAEKIAFRIKSLGGTPIFNTSEMVRLGNCRYPDSINLNSLNESLETLLNFKRCLIEVYNRIIKKTHGKDFVTYSMIESIMLDEVEEEEELESLL
ncbi:MAG: ferritin-like domain-containing protein [Thermoplasmata archaeon]|nr:ferritin-like domain-containing protein [Thermoplasmata archaeon]